MTVLDTSALIRFFTNDIPEKASVVKKVIDSDEKVLIPDVVFPELEYVLLCEVYKSSRQKVLQAFHFLISRKNTKVSVGVSIAVDLYSKTNLDIADCIIAASAIGNELLSFDNKLISAYKAYKMNLCQ